MKKQKNTELVKDDELLREEAMCDGPLLFGEIELRPITALTISWMQRNQVFADNRDTIWKGAAFAFLHSAPLMQIRAVVNDSFSFNDAVDSWIEKNIEHHSEIVKITELMNEAFKRYMASASETSGASPGN